MKQMMKRQTQAIWGPPGTGKTHTLAQIAREEAKRGEPMVFLSYTRAAAAEAAGRVKVGDICRTSTIHALAYAVMGLNRASVVDKKKLSAFGDAAGFPFQGMDDTTEAQEGDEYAAALQYANNTIIDPWAAYDHHGRPGSADRFGMFLKAYAAWKKTCGYVDFDDMLAHLAHSDHGASIRYPTVILDEAQDCSRLQWAAFETVAQNAERVYVAGDDDQAIHGWAGADPHGMGEFTDKHFGKWRVLEQSYRLPKLVWEQAHEVLSQISNRVDKTFRPTDLQGRVVRFGDVEDLNWKQVAENDTMFLVRDNYRLREIQKILHAECVPYRISGRVRSPFENKYAEAIRGILTGSEPTDSERDCIMGCGGTIAQADARNREWGRIRALGWKAALLIPPRLVSFYESVDLFAPLRLTLSTIHQAKGTEEKNVIVDLTLSPKVEQGVYQDRDAELRVHYVAMTRAKQELALCGGNPLI